MLSCSILTPAFTVSSSSSSSLLLTCAKNLGLNASDIDLFTLVPFTASESPQALVISIKSSSFSLTRIEELISQRELFLHQLHQSREALSLYSEVAQEKKAPINYEKTTKKLNKLEEDNKKLRQLLKTQLDNAENLRLATQRTVENLREEFDLLVRELLNVKKVKEKKDESPKAEKKSSIPKLKIGAN